MSPVAARARLPPGRFGSMGAESRLAAILHADDVLVDVEGRSAQDVFARAGALFEMRHGLAHGLVTDNLAARERLGSTALGQGVAIPHGRIKGLREPAAAVLRLREPITFGGPDDAPVQLLVVLLVPELATQGHLEILSQIAEMLSDRELRERLKAAPDADALYRAAVAWSPPGETR